MKGALARVQFHDQLLVDQRLNLISSWDAQNLAAEPISIRHEPVWNRCNLGQLKISQRELPRFWLIFHRDLVPGFDVVRCNIDSASVHPDVTVRDHLACRTPSIRETEPKNNVIEPSLQELKKSFSGNATFSECRLEDAPELSFQQTVLVSKLLLFSQGNCVVRLLAA